MAKSTSSRSAQNKKSAARKPTTSGKSTKAGDASTVTVDRRVKGEKKERRGEDRRQKSEPVAVERRKLERREKVNRRRQIDPTTCEREYTEAEIEFMNALELYKRKNGRMFPTCSEILEVITSLGYQKPNAPRTEVAGEAETIIENSSPEFSNEPADESIEG